eukprot:gene12884-biopygen8930
MLAEAMALLEQDDPRSTIVSRRASRGND